MVIAALFLALALPAVAPGPVEVEIESVGAVEVPAQGYRLSAFFATRQIPIPGSPAPAPADVVKRAIADANAIGVMKTPVCGEEAKLGFIGNEAAGGPAPEETDGEGFAAFTPFDAIYATVEQAQRAMALLKAAGGQSLTGPQGV